MVPMTLTMMMMVMRKRDSSDIYTSYITHLAQNSFTFAIFYTNNDNDAKFVDCGENMQAAWEVNRTTGKK